MRILMLLIAVMLSPAICEAGHMRNFGRYSLTQSRYAQAHNRTDYANSGVRQYYWQSQPQHSYPQYTYPSTGGYLNPSRYPDSWWGPSNSSYSAGYRLGRALRGR